MQNTTIVAQYLQLIESQQKEIDRLQLENATLHKIKKETLSQKRLYKESALEWKRRYDDIVSALNTCSESETIVVEPLIPETVRMALRIYESVQKS